MKILITGARGMLGSELARVFSDYQVFAWDVEELDITNEAQVIKKVEELSPDVIINAAAYNNVDGAEENKDIANKLNGYAPGILAKSAKGVGAIMVHYSTDYVFDGKNKNGYKEEDTPNPISEYGKSKLLGEREVIKNTDKYYIIRLSKLFGKEGSGEHVKKSFVDKMIELVEDREVLEVVDEELSSPTYAPDLAQLTLSQIEKKLPFGVYHGTNSGACTWYELANETFKVLGKDIKVIPISSEKFSRPAKRPENSILLNTKLPQQRSWQEALKEYLKSYKAVEAIEL